MNKRLQEKLDQVPRTPGVYFHKDKSGRIIYVGKAANLRNRVLSYFRQQALHDYKTKVLVGEISDIDWLEVGSEIEALFLESAMIKRYKPKFNIDLRDDKSWLYIKISSDDFPVVSFTRRPLDDRSVYYGPFTSSLAVRSAMKQLRRSFPYVTHRTLPKRACLHHHLGLCPGPEVSAITKKDYQKTISQLKRYLSGKGKAVIRDLEQEMKRQAKAKNYENAARARDQINNLLALEKQHLFSEQELFDLARDQALVDLKVLLDLDKVPRRIECYDISHIQGTNNVASMVVFTDGVPNRGEYRKFKMQLRGNDDFAHMQEVIRRRMKHWDRWPRPDLLVIDGGKGQVNAVSEVLNELGIELPLLGLAKKFERVILPKGKDGKKALEEVNYDRNSHLLKLLRHIRDEAHRFAVTYHSLLRSKAQTSSILEDIPGVGPKTRKKLIRHFGSYKGVKAASFEELEEVAGPKTARVIREHLG